MNSNITRRTALSIGAATLTASVTRAQQNANLAQPEDSLTATPQQRLLLTPAGEFRDVSRAKPHPKTLTPEQLTAARLTPDSWRLEITGEEKAIVPEPKTLAAGTAIDLAALHELFRKKPVRFLKAMQCLNISQPLGQGLWEGVKLRDVLALVGKFTDSRRVYYWGHSGPEGQLFRSSLSYTQVMESPPGEPPPIIVFRLNGEPLPIERGGPVRLVVPWAYGFKSIKWLQKIVLTSDYQANDTYAEKDNDPDSRMKTAAYLDPTPAKVTAGQPATFTGTAVSGLSGLERVECWIRPAGTSNLTDDDPAWQSAAWTPATLDQAPQSWTNAFPAGINPGDVWGFDTRTGHPKSWPLPYSIVGWSFQATDLAPGKYEIRPRSVDLNGFAQPEPRPYQKSGRNLLDVRRFEVTAT